MATDPLAAVSLRDVMEARERLGAEVLRSPLLPVEFDDGPLWLKLEALQPIGSFKLRGAGNAILAAAPERVTEGLLTVSAGNMAQGVAWWARRLGVRATAIVPDHAPEAKVRAIERLGGRVSRVPFDRWWGYLSGDEAPDGPGLFIHPVADPGVIAGNGTIGLEILEDLPEVETILVPFGGGGLSCGIGVAVHGGRPETRVIGCEVATAAPLAASLRAGTPVAIERQPSFVEGIGGKSLLPAMWELVRRELAGAAVVSLDSIAAAIRLLVQRARIVAEGAGAAGVAAALKGHRGGPTVCVISGGNIDAAVLAEVLSGRTPGPAPA